MIREIGKTITVSKTVEVAELVNREKILSILNDVENEIMNVSVAFLNTKDEVIQNKVINISGAEYNLLFSEDDIFEEGKQAGSYRESDLWLVIDKVE